MTADARLILMLATALAACSDKPDPNRQRRAHLPLDERVATADLSAGAGVFVRCSACHVVGETSGDRDGPNLWGVVGQPVASRSPRFAYTAALKHVGGVWTIERLDRWLTNPRAFALGTAMTFSGLSDPVDRADVIAFLIHNGPKPDDQSAGHHAPAPAGK